MIISRFFSVIKVFMFLKKEDNITIRFLILRFIIN